MNEKTMEPEYYVIIGKSASGPFHSMESALREAHKASETILLGLNIYITQVIKTGEICKSITWEV